MRFALFYHSVRSDWNHGNAHFLRGLMRALDTMGHQVTCYEEAGNWSVGNLVAQHGLRPLVTFRRHFPFARVQLYRSAPHAALEQRLRRELAEVDVVVLHEWTAVENPALVDTLARLRHSCGFALLFHDTHYRLLTEPERMARLGFDRFDAILAYGPSLAEEYRRRFGHPEVHVFHEAADVALFRPMPRDPARPMDDAVFIGNWGDDDRAAEMKEFLLHPARHFRPDRRFALYGVRYPDDVLTSIRRHYGIEYRGWVPNHQVPEVFAQARIVLHIIRRQYLESLPGIPTIRVFEALATGTPLISTYWPDTDHLFREGTDYIAVETRCQMEEALDWLWRDETARTRLAQNGLACILDRHTCTHRAEQLVSIVVRLRGTKIVEELDTVEALPAPVPMTGRRRHAEPVPALVAAAG